MKRKIEVIYDKNIDKQELFEMAKGEVKQIYKNLLELVSDLNESSGENKISIDNKIFNILHELDSRKTDYFRKLFLLSVFCSYFHQIKNKINIQKLKYPLVINECFKKHNFVVLDVDSKNTEQLLLNLIHYFNTDANNLMEITGKIFYDLQQIDLQLKPK